ncbi:MAG: aspartate aminotransferase family protein [Pseudomonadota bacterium]
MGHIFHRNPSQIYPEAVAGDGAYLIDKEGKRYLDASGGAAVSCLGHGDPDVVAATRAQLEQLEFAHTGFFTTDIAERLAEKLVAVGPGLDRVYLVSGGSEAMEAAIKLARQYFVERGEPQRNHIIARRQSYHGNTLGALATGGNEWRRAQFGPLLIEVSHIAPCYEYRERADHESLEQYALRAANELEDEVQRLGPGNVMAFVAEPVVGATAGAVPALDHYFKRVREICDLHGILLILDEVMCGMGRTGTLFACEQDGVRPDICAIAKGLGAGYQPIGAMMCTEHIYQTIVDGSGFFQHGHTYLGHPVAAAAALAVTEKLTDGGLVAACAQQGVTLKKQLRNRFGQHPHVGDIRGRGLFLGLELVQDRETKTPFERDLKVAPHLKAAAMKAGLICYPMQGTIDGRRGDHVLLAPPFIINDDQIGELVDKLEIAINAAVTPH